MGKHIKQFEVGKSYSTRSACNHDCVWTWKVIRRTACTVTLINRRGEVTTHLINHQRAERFGYESVMPLGNYSMCPVLSAD